MHRRPSKFSIVSPLDEIQPANVNEKHPATFSKSSPQDPTMSHIQSTLPSARRSQIAENFIIVWLNSEQTYSPEYIDKSITQLRDTAKSVNFFTDLNSCIDFITDIVFEEEVLFIVSGCCAQQVVSIIIDVEQIRSIYILHRQDEYIIENLRGCRKIKGIFTEIERVCKVIQRDASRLIIDLPSFSIISTDSTPKLDELDSSFMYTQLIKENIIEMKRDPNEVDKFVQYYLSNYPDRDTSLTNLIEEFQRSYKDLSAIWWYARETFAYATINKALRIQDTKTIIKMGFFLRDLHHEIQQAYLVNKPTTKLIVYRGQGMSKIEFDKLVKHEGGLLSFNSFLSTSLNWNVPLMFLDIALQNPDMVDIVFRIEVDPSISSTAYVNFRDTGLQDSNEEEILFCMQTVFRIDRISPIAEGMWEVDLKFTDDNDSQLKTVTDYTREQVSSLSGWYRMGILMQMMGKYDEALNICEDLLETSSNDGSELTTVSQSLITNSIVENRIYLGNYSNALVSLREMLKICQDQFSHDHPIFCRIYHNIAFCEHLIDHYPEALSNLRKVLAIALKHSSSAPLSMPTIYKNIGCLHKLMGNYERSLLCYEEALELLQKILPLNHPHLAISHNNIAATYQLMDNYPLALEHSEKASEIYQRSLPSDHPTLAANYSNIALTHQSMGNYPLALKHLEKASQIYERSIPADHPNLATNHNNIAVTHQFMGNYPLALKHLEKASQIYESSLPADHPNLATNLNSIGLTHQSMGNYPLALKYFENASQIYQKSLTPDHPELAGNHRNIG